MDEMIDIHSLIIRIPNVKLVEVNCKPIAQTRKVIPYSLITTANIPCIYFHSEHTEDNQYRNKIIKPRAFSEGSKLAELTP